MGRPHPPLDDVLDRTEALARLGGDEAFLAEILALFLADAPGMLERIQAARASGDAAELERAAHALKGASATIAALEVPPVALEIERLAREGSHAAAAERCSDLERAMTRLIEALAGDPATRRAA